VVEHKLDNNELKNKLERNDESVLRDLLSSVGSKIDLVLQKRFPTLSLEDREDTLAIAARTLWHNRAQYRPLKGTVVSWFYGFAKNVARELVKKKPRECPFTDLGLDVAWTADQLNSALDNGSQLKAILKEILDNLPENDKRIVLYHARFTQVPVGDDDCPKNDRWAPDLAEELGMKPGTIRQRRARVMKRITEEFLKKVSQQGIELK
jgi:DNA-directed RNA polymerase specialized sigma24 family protein